MRSLSLSRPSSRFVRWSVPAAAVVVLVGLGPALSAITADAHGSLPPRTPAQLLADVHGAKLKALSGTVVETSDLGLPQLPSIGGPGGNASFSSLVTGSHTMRIWYAGPDKVRLALLGQLGESDLVRNGTGVWAWSSADNTATHWTVPAGRTGTSMTPDRPGGAAMTPQQAAEAAVKAISPSTRVTTDPTAQVAGRPAYELVLEPKDSRSLVGSVRIAIDGATHVPTRVQVFARGARTPAFQVGFTSFSTSTPPDSTFAFTPPPGATVKQGSLPRISSRSLHHSHLRPNDAPQVVGKGWTSVVVAHTGASDAATRSGAPRTKPAGPGGGLMAVLGSLPSVSGSWGSGHLLRTSLFSAVLTNDGRIAIGAVSPSMLYAALGR
jgi:outer membrane lipoprotein-sorting protein